MSGPFLCGRVSPTLTRPPAHMARPKGSGNVFRHGDDVHEITRQLYGTTAQRIAQRRKEHIHKGCHVCMKEAEDRLYGKPPLEIKFPRKAQPPLLLKSVNGQVLSKGALQLEEPAVEGEFEEVPLEEMAVDGE